MGIGKIGIIAGTVILIAQWFDRRMGIAVGLAMAGVHLGGLIVAPLTEVLLGAFGW